MKFAVLVFPGSNCDHDMYHAIVSGINEQVEFVWYSETNLGNYDAILLPGGFSYGDYLRSGAIARFAPVMKAVRFAANEGKLILGVCNGFQILLEERLLPGAMCRNNSLKFCCFNTELEVTNSKTPFTIDYYQGETVNIPIAHGEGNYYCDQITLNELEDNNQIVFRYKDNPNGSISNIAGIINKRGNVLGMMPHPERAVEKLLGTKDGLRVFTSLVKSWRESYVTS